MAGQNRLVLWVDRSPSVNLVTNNTENGTCARGNMQ